MKIVKEFPTDTFTVNSLGSDIPIHAIGATPPASVDPEILYQQIAAVDTVMQRYLRQRENDVLVVEELKTRG